jgi:hypothetical protein
MNCVRLLRIELDNPNVEVSDAMIATVLSLAIVAVSLSIQLFSLYYGWLVMAILT